MSWGFLSRRMGVALVLVLALAGCGSPQPSPSATTGESEEPLTESAVTINVSQGAALLTEAGQTLQLDAEATDGDGAPLPVTWSSSNPDQVTVDEDGTVTAVTDLGSAAVYAEAADEWAPVTILIAQPADGAVLVADADVITGPEPLDAEAGPWVGTRERVVLSLDEPPAPGDILLATESAPIAGRVVAVSSAPGGTEVEYEIVTMPELFEKADISVDLPIDLRDVVEEAPEADVMRLADGRAIVRYRDNDMVQAVAIGREVEREFEKGPLKCKFSAGAKLETSDFSIVLAGKPAFQYALDWDRTRDGDVPRYAKVAVVGPITYEISGGFSARAGFEGKADCSIVLPVYIPIGGLLAKVLGFAVPVGIGVTADGSLKAVEIKFGPQGTVGADIAVGLECQSGTCISLEEVAPRAKVEWKSEVQTTADMKVALGVSVHGIIGLDVIVAKRFSLLEVRAGPRQSFDLAFDDTQARDAAYASSYDLRLAGTIGVGDDLKAAIEKIIGDGRDLSFGVGPDNPLARSPIGTLSADNARVQVKKPVKLVVELDPRTIEYFLIGENVAEVRIARREKDGSLTPLTTIPVSASRQTRFEWTWEPTSRDVGMNELVAFVSAKLLPGIPLEIQGDSTAYVEVVDACLAEGTPAPAPAAPGDSSQPARPTPAPSATPPPESPCSGNVTIRYTSTSHLHAADWTITGNIERFEEGMSLLPDQPEDEFVGTGTYTGRGVDGLTMSLSYIRPPRCERDSLWVAGDGEVYLTAFYYEDTWVGAPFEGPAMVIGVFQKGDFEENEMSPPYMDLFALAVPADGGSAEYPIVVMPEAECGEEWARNITVTYSPTETEP